MPHCSYSNHALPFLTDFSSEDRRLAAEALGQQEEQWRQGTETLSLTIDEITADYRRQLQDLVGAEKLALLRQEINRERLVLRDLCQPPEGLHLDYLQQKQASKQKIDMLLHSLGASPEQLEKIGTACQEKLEKLVPATGATVVPGYNLHRNLDRWMGLSPLHKFPLPWGVIGLPEDPTDPHRWFLFRPPFFGFLFRFSPQATSHFRVDRQLFLSPPAGLAGNEATMDCDDAGDFDAASVTAEAQIAFGFVPPKAGVIEVLIDAQSTIGKHELDIEDEYGSSNAWCNQNNYLMFNVLHPNVPEPSLALMSNLYKKTEGGDVNNMNRENLVRGQHYFAHLFSSGPVPAGQSVVITVGTRTFDIARANDMELHSKTNFQWFINSVEVRISP